jgi:putative ABC transport system permease protein
MAWLRALVFKLSAGRLGRPSEADFDDEVRSHLALLAERFVKQGLSPEDAATAARRQFGSVLAVRDARAELGRWRALEVCWWDLRFAIRGLRRHAGFAVTAVLLLALGIGANTAIFSVLDEVLIKALPVEHPDELVLVSLVISPAAKFQGAARLGFVPVREFLGPNAGIPASVIEKLRESSPVFSGLLAEGARVTADLRTSQDAGEPRPVRAAFVSGNYFSILGVAPASGRMLVDSDNDRTHGAVAVISYQYWGRQFGGDPNVVGRTVFVNDTACTVVGVARDGFNGSAVGNPTDAWVPLVFRQNVAPMASSDLTVIGRLKHGATRADAQANVRALLPSLRIGEAFEIQDSTPDWFDLLVTDGSTGVSKLREKHAAALAIGMGAAVVVLLIACANLAGLVLARATARRREVALLLSLGAGRWRVLRQIFMQNLVLAVAGGATGWLAARWGAAVLIGLVGGADVLRGMHADWTVLAFTAATTVVAALLFGLAPAIRAAYLDPKQVLNEGAPSTPGGRAPWRLLVPVQIAASMVLLVCALLFLRTLARLDAVDLGFNSDHLLMAAFDTHGVERGAQLAARADDLERRIQSLPGVVSTAIVTAAPFGEPAGGGRIMVAGYTPAADDSYFTGTSLVGPGFFRTSGIRIVRGRDFGASESSPDVAGAAAGRVAIVNEAFTRKFFGAGDPLGRQFTMSRAVYDIVGVAEDARYESVRTPAVPLAYFPIQQDPSRLRKLAVLVRFSGPATGIALLTSGLREVTRETGGLRIDKVETLRDLVSASFAAERLEATVSGGAGMLAVVLVSVGLFGTVAYTVTCRTRELGIRAALGGGRWVILRMLMRETLVLVLAGIGLGIPIALATAQRIASQFYGVGAADPWSIVGAVALMLAVAIVASIAPAFRAAGIHPMIALRHD